MRRSTATFLACSALGLSGVLGVAAVATSAGAHARLLSPVPRTDADGVKTAPPCGPPAVNPADASVTTYMQGQEIEVRFEETVQHTGCFVVQLLENNYQKQTMLLHVPDLGNTTLNQPIVHKVKLPDGVACNGCALQLQQVMSGTVCPANVIPDASTYYSCASINITYADGGLPPPSEASAPPPSSGGTSGGSTTGAPADDDDDHGGMGHDDDTEKAPRAKDDSPTEPATTLCSVSTVGAPGGFGALLLSGIALLAGARRRRR